MEKRKLNLLRTLAVAIIILAAIASAGGLLLDGLYRDNAFLTMVWKTTDLMILLVALPLSAAALVFVGRGSTRWLLVLLAMMDFTLYNYSYYLFGSAFNWFFLLYVAIVVLSAAALIIGLIGIDVSGIKQQFKRKTPVRWISGYMLFVAIGLTTIYLIMTFAFIFTGQLPVIVEITGHVTNVVFALDLTMVVPVFIFAAVWLWKRQPWGYVLAGISVIKGAVYSFILAVVTVAAANNGFPESASEIPLWATLSAGGIAASLVLLLNIKAPPENTDHLST